MKIDRTGPARPAAPAKRSEKAGKSQDSKFSQHLKSGPDAVAGPSAAGPVSTVDALLSIQEVEDSTSGKSKSKARKWGHDMLDQLEQLRIGIVGGVVPRADLERIAASIERQRVRTNDPLLELILDEIELRAKVELAKLDRDL
jgi:Class II flagellar assembly regulator